MGTINANVGGTWRKAASMHANVGGTWRKAKTVYVNVGGVWRPITFGPEATGGSSYTSTIGGDTYMVHVFNNTGTFTVTSGGLFDILVIGGGGGGGSWYGGGGGAGGVAVAYGVTLDAVSYLAAVGLGGNGSTANTNEGQNGDYSYFAPSSTGVPLLQAPGGGGGGSYYAPTGKNGGCGGGAAWNGSSTSYGGSVVYFGNSIGYSYGQAGANVLNSTGNGGGGGGAVEKPADVPKFTSPTSCNGGIGAGIAFTSDTTQRYGGGGGGARYNNTNSAGGDGGGGYGGCLYNGTVYPPGNGFDTRGGGGGGAYTGTGGKGGSGWVAIRYKI